jgi:hypothetical protein
MLTTSAKYLPAISCLAFDQIAGLITKLSIATGIGMSVELKSIPFSIKLY